FPAVSNTSDPDLAAVQASSITPVNDNRIAALWSVIPGLDDTDGKRLRRDCTASYVGDNFWLTAHHCVSSTPFMDGFLQQSDGDTAGIAAIYTKSSTDDVAHIKVGDGINADPFVLANRPMEIGDQALLTGYGQPHDYASSALTVISEEVESLNFGNVTYTDLFKGRSSTALRSCGGDSGAPVYKGEVLYAVHTAGGFNPTCSDGQDRPMWHTNIVRRVPWVEETLHNNTGLTDREKSKADTGLNYAAALFPDSDEHQAQNTPSSLSESPSSSFALSSTRAH
ncbi:trypsin-like serine protease, partial [Corynebacterium flavescens]|uniref:trypsin-like serine protease n=2 Tax=Corynebacterium flavescens TaxID=28028 RepID=UPI003FD4DC0B